MMQIVPLPLDADAPRFVLRGLGLTAEDVAHLTKRPGAWAVYDPSNVDVEITAPEEPLDRLAGMISDDDLDAALSASGLQK